MSISTISPAKFAELYQQGKAVELIDVRTPVEFREVHVDQAKNIPLDKLDPAAFVKDRNGASQEPVYVICKSGGRGQQASQTFLTSKVEPRRAWQPVCRWCVAKRQCRWNDKSASRPDRWCCWEFWVPSCIPM